MSSESIHDDGVTRTVQHFPERRGAWQCAGASDVGKLRTVNEDAFLLLPEQQAWVVADGMGGHMAGDVASETIVEAFRGFSRARSLASVADDVEELLIMVNQRLRDLAESAGVPTTIGSTVVVLVAVGRIALLCWAGDSRIYRLRDGKLRQLTHDHSQVAEMVAQGLLPYEIAEEHPASNVITRAVGALDSLFVDMDYCDIRPGDRFLLCSDGLTKELPASLIADVLGRGQPVNEACRQLIDLTLDAGARDNVTVVLAQAPQAAGE